MNSKTGVLLVNLGTPDSPEPSDVKKYLIEFLTDGRVIDTPWLLRQFLVRGVIVPRRYRESAKAYGEIWTEEGSPLMVYSARVASKLQKMLGADYYVELAMRYQNPSIPSILRRFQHDNLNKIIIVPLFPQYASATTGSIHQKVMESIHSWQTIPEVTFINNYHDHPGLINAFCENAKSYNLYEYDHIIFSFHGLPEKQLINADTENHCLKTTDCCKKLTATNHSCYAAQCYSTARSIAQQLSLKPERYTITFQSRLGKDPWIQPYTADTILNLREKGASKILVFCPAFTSDCLETIHEIGIELRAEFIEAGGQRLDLVPSLNDTPLWIETLADLVIPKQAQDLVRVLTS